MSGTFLIQHTTSQSSLLKMGEPHEMIKHRGDKRALGVCLKHTLFNVTFLYMPVIAQVGKRVYILKDALIVDGHLLHRIRLDQLAST